MELSISDLSKYLGVTVDTIERWVRQGKLPVSGKPSDYRFRKADLEKWAAIHNIRLNFSGRESIVKKNEADVLLSQAVQNGGIHFDITGNEVKSVLKSSIETDDRAWHLPNYPELKDSVKSNIADIKNLGFPKGIAGTLTAAEFLRQFVGDTKWAHIDIAGTAFVEGTSRMYYGHGATGAGVRLLTNYLQNN